MRMRRIAAAASCGVLVLCSAACSREAAVVTPEGSGREVAAAADPSAAPEVTGQAEAVDATVVVEGTFDADLTFCRQRGPVTIQLARRGDVLRGEFSGPAPQATSDHEPCDEQREMTGFWEIDISDPERPDVVECVVNGNVADTAILLPRDSGVEVECTRAAAGGLVETAFFVDL